MADETPRPLLAPHYIGRQERLATPASAPLEPTRTTPDYDIDWEPGSRILQRRDFPSAPVAVGAGEETERLMSLIDAGIGWGGDTATHARTALVALRASLATLRAATAPVLTYANQPDNDAAWALGLACQTAAKAPAGDPIDRGLVLLRELQTRGFGVVHLPAPARSSAEEGTTTTSEPACAICGRTASDRPEDMEHELTYSAGEPWHCAPFTGCAVPKRHAFDLAAMRDAFDLGNEEAAHRVVREHFSAASPPEGAAGEPTDATNVARRDQP